MSGAGGSLQVVSREVEVVAVSVVPDLLTVEEAARVLRISRATAYKGGAPVPGHGRQGRRRLEDKSHLGGHRHRSRHADLEAKLRRLDTLAAQHIDRLREIQNQRDRLQPARERWSAWHADHKRDIERLTSLNLHIRVAKAIRDRRPEQTPDNRTPDIPLEPPSMDLLP